MYRRRRRARRGSGLAQELLQTQRRLSAVRADAASELSAVQQAKQALANQLAEVQAAASLLQARVDHQLPRPTQLAADAAERGEALASRTPGLRWWMPCADEAFWSG